MASTDRFVVQHEDLLKIAGQMAALFNAGDLEKDASTMRSLLSMLAGKLKIHLALEDEHLYPKLLQHSDAQVRETAKFFVHEMGGIADAFTQYMEKWPTPSSIQANPQSFIDDTSGIFKVLGERIEKENSKLYPLVENAA
jgi:hemerythrin-like domain-containing protein